METPTRSQLATVMFFWAVQSRHDLREKLCEDELGFEDAAWKETGIPEILEEEAPELLPKLRNLFIRVDKPQYRSAEETNDAVDLLWRSPPCPPKSYIKTALSAMIDKAQSTGQQPNP